MAPVTDELQLIGLVTRHVMLGLRRFLSGGCAIPIWPSRRCTVGADISRAWNHFLDRHRKGHGDRGDLRRGELRSRSRGGREWTGTLEKVLNAKGFENVVMKEEYELSSPLNVVAGLDHGIGRP